MSIRAVGTALQCVACVSLSHVLSHVLLHLLLHLLLHVCCMCCCVSDVSVIQGSHLHASKDDGLSLG